jgi:hypothetical protein
MAKSSSTGGFIAFAGDVSSITPGAEGPARAYTGILSLQATNTAVLAPEPVSVLPVVGSTPGALGGAFFRTSVQLHNPHVIPISGTLLYHAQGTSGTTSDPSLFYALQPGETSSIPDLLPAIDLSGLGSLDVVPEAGSHAPRVLARVFNDAGDSGTTGFTQEPVRSTEALGVGQKGILIAPSDPLLFRFNIGVRTFSMGATLAIAVRRPDGEVRRALTRSYPPNYFEQTGAGRFITPDEASTGIFPPLDSNESVTIEVVAGKAVVYGATIDNRTNDPSFQLARGDP